jgi:hypothetical protein
MSVVDELNDTCFVMASDAIRQLVAAFEEETGRKPTLTELCELLTWGVRNHADQLLEGSPNHGIVITGKASTAKQRLKKGDVVAVPMGNGRFAALVAFGKLERFGHTFGIIKGAFLLSQLAAEGWKPRSFRRYPVRSGDELVANGRWIVVANRPDLLSSFDEPRIYHHPEDAFGRDLGQYGLEESVDGSVAKLSAESANAVFGDIPKRNRQGVFLEEELESYLIQSETRN